MLNLNKILSLLIVFSTFEVFSLGEFNFKVNDENIILGKEIFENIADHHYSNKIEKQTFHVQYIFRKIIINVKVFPEPADASIKNCPLRGKFSILKIDFILIKTFFLVMRSGNSNA